jgi:hypothetical protein
MRAAADEEACVGSGRTALKSGFLFRKVPSASSFLCWISSCKCGCSSWRILLISSSDDETSICLLLIIIQLITDYWCLITGWVCSPWKVDFSRDDPFLPNVVLTLCNQRTPSASSCNCYMLVFVQVLFCFIRKKKKRQFRSKFPHDKSAIYSLTNRMLSYLHRRT